MARIIDLSHPLVPGSQRFKLAVKHYPVERILPQYKSEAGKWYIMSEITMCSHVGTHVEAPFHALENGVKVHQLDLRRLVGAAVLIDCTDKKGGEGITRRDLTARCAGALRDRIVLIRTGWARHFGTPRYRDRPHMTGEAVQWLVEQDIKSLGIDCSGIEDRSRSAGEPNHALLFAHGIPMIEDLNNLERIESREPFFFALPLPVSDLDASMIRPLAIEPIEAARRLDSILGRQASWEIPSFEEQNQREVQE